MRDDEPEDLRDDAPLDLRDDAPLDLRDEAPLDLRDEAPLDLRDDAPLDLRDDDPLDFRDDERELDDRDDEREVLRRRDVPPLPERSRAGTSSRTTALTSCAIWPRTNFCIRSSCRRNSRAIFAVSRSFSASARPSIAS